LQPGDIVQVTVWQRDELSGEFTVAPDGSLNHPLYRQVRVTGVPATQIEDQLRSFLTAYEANPQVVVQPFYKVTVAGSVMRPDIYNLPPGTTVSQAVTQAGGVTEEGKRDDVRLYRNTNETRLDLTEPEAIGMLVQSGDQILVRDKSSGMSLRSVILPILQIGLTITNIVVR
jgi:polysaccharide export outer membrane protein